MAFDWAYLKDRFRADYSSKENSYLWQENVKQHCILWSFKRIGLYFFILRILKTRRNEFSCFRFLGNFLRCSCCVLEGLPWLLFLEIVSRASFLIQTFHRGYLRKVMALLPVSVIFRVRLRYNCRRCMTKTKFFHAANHCVKLVEMIDGPIHVSHLILKPSLF